MAGVIPSGTLTGDRHYGTAWPHREGAGVSSHPAQTLQGETAESCSPQRAVCLSAYFSHLSNFPAQFKAGLLATEPSQCQQTRDSHGGGIWQCPGPGTGNLAPSQDVCMGVLGQKLMTGKQRNTDPLSIQHQCVLPGPHFVGALSLLYGVVM